MKGLALKFLCLLTILSGQRVFCCKSDEFKNENELDTELQDKVNITYVKHTSGNVENIAYSPKDFTEESNQENLHSMKFLHKSIEEGKRKQTLTVKVADRGEFKHSS